MFAKYEAIKLYLVSLRAVTESCIFLIFYLHYYKQNKFI